MEKKILKKRQSASQETKELSEQGAEKSNSGLITAGMLLYSKTELSEARARLFLVESVDAETGEITALGLTTKAGTDDSLWEIARTEENKLFKPYLAQLEAQYIFSHDWPFVIQPQCVQKSQLEELLEAREQYKKDNKLRRIMMREAPLEGTDKLQQQIKEMCDNFKRDPKQYMEYLRFAGQFYQYSIRNRMLIYRQNPYATFVASRTAWNQKEAHILPDQQLKGISILRPITTELIKRENDWVAVRMATNEEREKIAKGELKIYEKTYFAISKVYDISQTDFPKDRYPEIYSMGQKSMDHAEVYACVKELARASGIPVKKEQLPSISLHGYYSPSENAITINSNLEDTKAAVTLCHEYAHGLLHRTSTQSEAICEFEAQSLALMLMARYGLPQDDSEIGYMKTYLERANNDKNFSLDTSLERLQKQLKFVDERISLIAEHRQTEFAQTRAQAREPGKGKQVSENFRVGL